MRFAVHSPAQWLEGSPRSHGTSCRDATSINLMMGDHSSSMQCQQVLALTQEIKFTVRLQY